MTLFPLESVRVMLEVLMVEESMDSLKVTMISPDTEKLVAPLNGVVAATVGAVVSEGVGEVGVGDTYTFSGVDSAPPEQPVCN